MATIEKRQEKDGTISYRVKIRLKGHPTETATFERRTDARIWAQQTEAAIREGRYFKVYESKRRTLEDLIARYKLEELPKLRSDQNKRESHLAWWSAKLGRYHLKDITPAMLTECRNKLLNEPITRNGEPVKGTKKAAGTVNRYLATLSAAFACAVKDWSWMDENPMLNVRKPKEPRGRVRFLSASELNTLLDAVSQSTETYLWPVVLIALSTGARWSEILGLRWQNVDFKHNIIRLEQTKNDERRSVPIGQDLRKILKYHHKDRRLDTDLLFPRSDGKAPKQIRKQWEAALKKSEVPDFHFHDLRHTCASNLAMGGASLLEIAEILGHKTIQVTQRYSHLTKTHTAEVVERMNKKMFVGVQG